MNTYDVSYIQTTLLHNMDKNKHRIVNVFNDIANDSIKGNFSNDKYTYVFPVITIKNKIGNDSTWQIFVSILDQTTNTPVKFTKAMLMPKYQLQEGIVGVLKINNITHTGKRRLQNDIIVTKGTNIGKENETNAVSQAIILANSKYNDHHRKSPANLPADMVLPMLLQDFTKVKISDAEYNDGIIVERKYDGIRAMSYLSGGSVCIYSRTAIKYDTLSEIEKELMQLYNILGNDNIYLDGELYIHGKPLQDISGAVRGIDNLDRSMINYIIFDVYDKSRPNLSTIDRKNILDAVATRNVRFNKLFIIQYEIIHSRIELENKFNAYISEGYEGLVVRRLSVIYEQSFNNYHSKNILKLKPHNSAEFKITGFTEGTKGKDVGALIIKCECNGIEFSAVPLNMTYAARYHIFKRFNEMLSTFDDVVAGSDDTIFNKLVLGKNATIQYSILGKSGIPQQPKFVEIRDDVDNVIQRLFTEM